MDHSLCFIVLTNFRLGNIGDITESIVLSTTFTVTDLGRQALDKLISPIQPISTATITLVCHITYGAQTETKVLCVL